MYDRDVPLKSEIKTHLVHAHGESEAVGGVDGAVGSQLREVAGDAIGVPGAPEASIVIGLPEFSG